MGFERSGGQSGAREVPEARTLKISATIWSLLGLLERLLTDLLAKWEVLGMLLGLLGGRFGFDLGSKIDVSTGIADFSEFLHSPPWSMVFRDLSGRFWEMFCGRGCFMMVPEAIWKDLEGSGRYIHQI